MYETGTAVEVRAVHRMPGRPPPEGLPHAHDYRLDVVVGCRDLDEEGMVVDLDLLAGLLETVRARLAGADLDAAVGGGEPVTVERFARWLHAEVAAGLPRRPGLELAVRVFETERAFGGYRAELPAR